MDIFVKNSAANNKQEIISELVNYLVDKGYVKDSYEDAIYVRELDFPTGLELSGEFNVAIPHAETEHVSKPAIILGILDNPIKWENMEDPDTTIMVHLVFLLAIKDPEKVVPNLKALADNVFSKPDIIKSFKESGDFDFVKTTLKKLIVQE